MGQFLLPVRPSVGRIIVLTRNAVNTVEGEGGFYYEEERNDSEQGRRHVKGEGIDWK